MMDLRKLDPAVKYKKFLIFVGIKREIFRVVVNQLERDGEGDDSAQLFNLTNNVEKEKKESGLRKRVNAEKNDDSSVIFFKHY